MNTIMAIDLGRYKSVVCFDQRDTRAATFRSLDTTPEIVQELFQEHPRALVVVEACANAGWVHDVAVACGLRVKVANTAGEAWIASETHATSTTIVGHPLRGQRSITSYRRRPKGYSRQQDH